MTDNIMIEIYTEMYRLATPSADLKQLMEEGTTKKPGWFLDYYLPMDVQEQVINEICDKHKLIGSAKYKNLRKQIHKEIMLGAAPMSEYLEWRKRQ